MSDTSTNARLAIRSGVGVWLLALLALPHVVMADVSCSVSATGPNFGIYDPSIAAPDDANGTVSVRCTLRSGYSEYVSLTSSYSTGSSGSYASRTLRSGAQRLNYNLFYDYAHTQIRGDGTGGSLTGGANFRLTRRNPTQSASSTVYGRIPGAQDVGAGTYLDTIIVTITY